MFPSLFSGTTTRRYDARGALHDLSQHEPPIGGYGNRLDCLAPAEQRAEQLCEEERYYSLYANEVEEEIYQGEGEKNGVFGKILVDIEGLCLQRKPRSGKH